INASTNGNASTRCQRKRREIFDLIVFSCGAAFMTDRVAFSYPVPMLDGSLTLVIPAHNEAANMVKVIGGSVGTLSRLAPEWEIVLVDDGSTDDTVEVARRAMGAQAGRLRVIRHEGKRGYGITVADRHRALLAGAARRTADRAGAGAALSARRRRPVRGSPHSDPARDPRPCLASAAAGPPVAGADPRAAGS